MNEGAALPAYAAAGMDNAAGDNGDEFWDYDRQVDLEGFTSGKLYEHLDSQV